MISVKYESQGAMLPPQMNISSTGVIPTSVQTFRFVDRKNFVASSANNRCSRVRLLCTGMESAQTQVQLQLNVSANNKLQNETSLNFRRNKICIKGNRIRMFTRMLGCTKIIHKY